MPDVFSLFIFYFMSLVAPERIRMVKNVDVIIRLKNNRRATIHLLIKL